MWITSRSNGMATALARIQRTLDVAGRDFTALDGNDAVAVEPP